MENNKLFNFIFIVALCFFAQQAIASEYQGSLNTGLETNFQGTVLSPIGPPPSSGGSSGGGGGGGGAVITTQSSNKAGDIDGDSKIDIKDFNMLMVNWGRAGQPISGDLNGDGKVDILDFNLLMVNWGK